MPSSGSGAKVKVIKMHFEIPIEPHTASRPRWTNKGDLTVTHMPKGYREFRNKFNNWLVEWLNETHDELLLYLSHLEDGRPIMNSYVDRRGRHQSQLVADFAGYKVKLVCVIPRPKHSLRAFPVSAGTADIDNYSKAVVDGIFSSDAAKYIGLNDLWIQDMRSIKRYTAIDSDETPHIEVDIWRIEKGGRLT